MFENLKKKLALASILFCSISHSQSFELPKELQRQTLTLSRQGEKPTYDSKLCMKIAQGTKEWQPKNPDEKSVKNIILHKSSAQLNGLLSFIGEDVMWWARIDNEVNIGTLPRAFHESNHVIDLQLTSCNDDRATYFFNGQAYVTDLLHGSIPSYTIAAEKIPEKIKRQPLGRYPTYFERARPAPGNDLTILVDELNAYLTGAQLEVALADTYLYGEAIKSGKYRSYDGNIAGTADFMLYLLSYLKSVEEKSPDSYLKIKNSPLFIAHVQRLWTAAERVLMDAKPYATENGGIYYVDQNVLDVIYSGSYISELDKLGLPHVSAIQMKLVK
ncbi:hypothetical protein [Janthinobacterium sp. RB2R34]|uniref:hypothetical protein n=1 Tax=Janthinobacterium sp. RB2R34 TaxID=3424193 RepID=UPI003F299C51